jgi:hypothetical protein
LCLALPSLQRGLSNGINDHLIYYQTFLREFKEGKVIPDLKNHTIKSFFIKAIDKTAHTDTINISDYKAQMRISNIILLIMLVVLSGAIYSQVTRHERGFSFMILSAIFIFTHMISGITWAAHLVTSLFWFLPLFLIDWKKFTGPYQRVFHFFLIFIALFLAIEGSDTTGKSLYTFLRTFDVFVIYPVILFFYYMYWYFKGERNIYREDLAPQVDIPVQGI